MDWGKIILELWTYHKGKTVGVLIGFLFGLMVIILGFFEAVFILICIIGGYFIGRRADESVNVQDFVDRFLNKR